MIRALAERLPFLGFLSAFIRTRRLQRRLKTRADIDAWQAARVDTWLRDTIGAMPWYRDRQTRLLSDLPVVDKATLMAEFDRFNRPGIAAAEGFAMIAEGRSPPGLIVGASTGTSGNRGLFVISQRERFEWLGVIVAKLLPRFPFESARVALVLPLMTPLYSAANRSPLLNLRFFDLKQGIDALAPQIESFRPDTVIAPPKVLRHLAEQAKGLAPRRLFCSAEVLDPVDQKIVETRFGVTLREIYMATEGLFGVACPLGTLHLAEDVVHFELEPVAGSDLVSPIVTDFTRRTQAMARYRMNDLLRLAKEPCACGSPLRAVAEVIGRRDDVFELDGADGRSPVMVTPDIIRNAVVMADWRIDDFRVVQTGPADIRLLLPETLNPSVADGARDALAKALTRLGAECRVEVGQSVLQTSATKLRRVERQWREAP